MLVRDTGNLQLPVSLTEIRAPLAVAAARLRAQPLRPALLVGGVALAFALLLSVLGGTLAARQQSLQRTLAALPQSERGFRIDRFGLPLDPGGYAQADRRARRALEALGAGGTRRVVLFRELRVQGKLVELAASDDLDSIVRVRSGRLPRSCTAAGCELLQIGRGGSARLDEGGLHLRRVGVAALRDPKTFGDVTASTSGSGTAPLLLLAPGVDSLQGLAALRPFYRVYSWVSALGVDRLHTWDVARIFADESRAQSRIGADPGDAAERTGRGTRRRHEPGTRRRRPAGARRRGAERTPARIRSDRRDRAAPGPGRRARRLLTRGARRWQGALASTAEIGAVTLGGALLGIAAGAAITAAVASAAGLRQDRSSSHTLFAGRTLAALGCAWAAATLLLTLATYTREGEGSGRRVTLLDVAALGAAATIAVALGRGALDPQSSTFGGTVLFLLLPLLVCFVVAVVLARVLGPAMRAAELATRHSRIRCGWRCSRSRARPPEPSASCAFVAVALGLALFAAAYRGTLTRGASDQAGFEVPLDFTVAEGSRARSAARRRRAGQLRAPGERVPGTSPERDRTARGSAVLSPTVLGVPSGALARMFWRSDFGSRPRLARAARSVWPGSRFPLEPSSLDTGGRNGGLDVRLAIEDARGRVRTVPLRPQFENGTRGRLGATLPPGRLVGLQLALTNLEQFALAHRETEAEVTTAPTGTIDLGPLRAGSRLLTDWRGWRLPGASVTRAGRRVRIAFTFPDTGASLAFRPPEPTDGRPMPVVVSPDLAAAAGGVGHSTVLDFQDARVPARIVGVARKLPTVPSDSARSCSPKRAGSRPRRTRGPPAAGPRTRSGSPRVTSTRLPRPSAKRRSRASPWPRTATSSTGSRPTRLRMRPNSRSAPLRWSRSRWRCSASGSACSASCATSEATSTTSRPRASRRRAARAAQGPGGGPRRARPGRRRSPRPAALAARRLARADLRHDRRAGAASSFRRGVARDGSPLRGLARARRAGRRGDVSRRLPRRAAGPHLLEPRMSAVDVLDAFASTARRAGRLSRCRA